MQFPNLTFPAIFQAPLVTQGFSPLILTVPRTPPSRILLLSDTHLGASGPIESEKTRFISELAALIARERITHVFHLGDLVNGTFPNGAPHVSDVLSRMEGLDIPVTLIGGNHDREYVAACTRPLSPLIRVVKHLAIRLDFPPATGGVNGQRIFLAHDLGNNYRVRDQFTYLFLHWLKTSYPKVIREQDWLLMGHCHMGFLSTTSKLGCVGQFSPEINTRAYGIIEVDETKIDVRVKQLL
jgi:predicted phosphodiesterase